MLHDESCSSFMVNGANTVLAMWEAQSNIAVRAFFGHVKGGTFNRSNEIIIHESPLPIGPQRCRKLSNRPCRAREKLEYKENLPLWFQALQTKNFALCPSVRMNKEIQGATAVVH